MDKILNKSLPIWQLALYFFMIGFTFISVPKSGLTYVLYARAVQAFELIFFIVLLFENFKRGFRLNKFNILTNCWWLFYTTLTYLFTLTIVGLTPMFKWMNIIIFLLLGNCYWKDNMKESVRYMAIVSSFFIYLNAILFILYPDGIWVDQEWIGRGDARRYLFGNYNQTGVVCLLGITLQSIHCFATKKGYFNLFCLILLSLASVIYIGSMTSAVGLSALACGILFRRSIARNMKLILLLFVVVYVLFFIYIIWNGNTIDEISLADQFIEGTLSKDTSFSGRTKMWANAVAKIKESPIIGFGVQSVEWNDKYLGGSGPHNLWLMLLLQGGVVLCLGFINVVIYSVKAAIRAHSDSANVAIMGLGILLLMSLFETYSIIVFFLFVQILYYTSTLFNQEDTSLQTTV